MSTLAERTTPCVCCGHPLSHRHHLMEVGSHGENRHTVQFCPNCHDLFHVIQRAIIRESRSCDRLLRRYMEVKGKNDSAFRYLLPKVLEVEELQETFTRNALKVTEAVREQLALYVPALQDIDILGSFQVVRDANGVRFKVGARVSEKSTDGQVSETLWVFHFRETEVIKVETLRVTRGADGLFVPVVPSP